MTTQTTIISLSTYNIYIGNIWSVLQDYLARKNYPRIFVIVDENTKRDCWPLFQKKSGLTNVHLIETTSGELNKNIQTCTDIWQQMMDQAGGRRDLTINLGGGVIGDMGGFCAATFKRGMDFIQMPTTLLSQVDSSLGGKLGIDFGPIKNSVGLFQDPLAVMICPDFLDTLPPRQLRSGFAEIIKHSLIADAEQWKGLQGAAFLTQEVALEFLKPSLLVKKAIVAEDPYENGIRKALNFGHTIGHAMEGYALPTENPLLHGEAIAAGMICEAKLSQLHGHLTDDELNAIRAFFIIHYGRYQLNSDSYPELLDLMKQDKKNDDHRINFTMLKRPGEALINQFCSDEEIIASLEYYRHL